MQTLRFRLKLFRLRATILVTGAIVSIVTFGCVSVYADAPLTSSPSQTVASSTQMSYEGRITQVTPGAFIIITRYGNRSIVIQTSASTTYGKTVMLRPRDLEIGDVLNIYGDVDQTANLVNVRLAYVQNSATPISTNNFVPSGKQRGTFQVTVSQIRPDVEVETADGNAYKLRIREKSMIVTTGAGSADDLQVGNNVRITGLATGSLDSEIVSANHIELIQQEGPAARRLGRRRRLLLNLPAPAQTTAITN